MLEYSEDPTRRKHLRDHHIPTRCGSHHPSLSISFLLSEPLLIVGLSGCVYRAGFAALFYIVSHSSVRKMAF